LLLATPSLASAADLIVGVVRDTDGYPVGGGTVTLRGPGGTPAGTGKTAADGTFAVESGGDVASVDVRCAYCIGVTVTRVAGAPVVAVVKRFAALRDHGISAADALVLPYYNVSKMASLMPFVVTNGGSISDRGLAGAQGTVVSDGFGLYRSSDDVDLSTRLPAHAASTISEIDPSQANAYASNSAGGLFSIDTLDQSAGLARGDAGAGGDLVLRGGNDLRGAFSTAGGAYAATRGVLDGTLPAGGGTLDLRAIAANAIGINATGFSGSFSTPVRASALNATLSMTRSMDANGPDNDSVAALSLQSGALTYGVRAQRESGLIDFGTGVNYDARAYVQVQHDDGRTRLFASLAAANDGESLDGKSATNGAVLPILTASTRIGSSFEVHADSVDALLTTPLYVLLATPNDYSSAVDRSQLVDAGAGFDDGNRIRVDLMAFRQTVTGATFGITGGSGISTVWQIAPSLALRSWTLISHDSGTTYGGGVYPTGVQMQMLDRNVTWLTAGNVMRVDAIWRSGNLEGDVSVPIGAHARIVAGTRRDGTTRVVTAGISWP
jgi:hypothetical protein